MAKLVDLVIKVDSDLVSEADRTLNFMDMKMSDVLLEAVNDFLVQIVQKGHEFDERQQAIDLFREMRSNALKNGSMTDDEINDMIKTARATRLAGKSL